MNFDNKLLEDAVQAFASLPGIGKKSALRMVLHLLKQQESSVQQFCDSVAKMRSDLKFCQTCNYLAEAEQCAICTNPVRDNRSVCVVETIREVLAIENTGTYNGLYHVLGGIISPVDGIGPDKIAVQGLIDRIEQGEISEVIMALSPTMEGDTTIFYISKQLENKDVRITTISRGVAFGGEIEYTDDLTLARSLASRMPYEKYLVNK